MRPSQWQNGRPLPVVSAEVRDNIAAQVPGRYQDAIRLRGHITAADVANGRFAIHDERARSIPGVFTREQERTVTTALRDHDSVVVEIDGEAIYEPDGSPYRIISVTAIRDVVANGGNVEETRELWLRLAALGRTGATTGIPPDASENLDHYLYGERD